MKFARSVNPQWSITPKNANQLREGTMLFRMRNSENRTVIVMEFPDISSATMYARGWNAGLWKYTEEMDYIEPSRYVICCVVAEDESLKWLSEELRKAAKRNTK